MAPSNFTGLRFLTCGSVDDGKSTLIGRLLYESRQIRDDELLALAAESKRYGTQGDRIDLALLMDGLQAERDQGITIDVAYRYFATDRRRFIVADSPGHEEYTANMATGASTAELAVLLVDARKGFLTQTRRHMRIVSLMGVRHVVLAVNKMDLVDYKQTALAAVAAEAEAAAIVNGIEQLVVIPTSALEGENIVWRSSSMPWYDGPTLLEHLEQAAGFPDLADAPFRMPIQWINRPNSDFRGVCGRIVAGRATPGMRVRVLPSGTDTKVQRIISWNGDSETTAVGDAITVTLADAVDANRGDVLASVEATPECADQVQCHLIWLSSREMIPGRAYVLKIHHMEVTATVTAIRYREDVESGAHLAAATLAANDIGVVTITTSRPIVVEPYRLNRVLGGFILIDTLTRETAGAGMVDFATRRVSTSGRQAIAIGKETRALQMRQTPRCVWITGLSGAGKSTIANALEQRLFALGRHSYILDGDVMRRGLSWDLAFSDADRVENVRRVAEVARLMVDAGLIVLVSLIAPFRAERDMARSLFSPGEFIEVFVDAPLEVCEARDPKGLYAKARNGELSSFTGIDSPYEAPTAPELRLNTAISTVDECVELVLANLT